MIKIRKGFPLISLVAMPLLMTIGWALLYSDQRDPKNLRYSCWKVNLCSMDLDKAVDAVVNDPNRMDLIRGKTVAQLERKFGYVSALNNSYEYLQLTKDDYIKGKEVVFLRHSDLMVIFENGYAVDAVYVKG
jgi:hypothetical protein